MFATEVLASIKRGHPERVGGILSHNIARQDADASFQCSVFKGGDKVSIIVLYLFF